MLNDYKCNSCGLVREYWSKDETVKCRDCTNTASKSDVAYKDAGYLEEEITMESIETPMEYKESSVYAKEPTEMLVPE